MIKINLLPDSRLARLKAASRQKTIGVICTIGIIAGVTLPVVLFVVWLGQKGVIALRQKTIDNKYAELQEVENLEEILTVQNQLNTLPSLNEQRLYYTTFFEVLPNLIPNGVSVSSFTVEESGTVDMSGVASSSALIEDFVAILKRAELYTENEFRPAFTDVFSSKITPLEEGGASFELNYTIDAVLFQKKFVEGLRVSSKVIKEPNAQPVESQNQPIENEGAEVNP